MKEANTMSTSWSTPNFRSDYTEGIRGKKEKEDNFKEPTPQDGFTQ